MPSLLKRVLEERYAFERQNGCFPLRCYIGKAEQAQLAQEGSLAGLDQHILGMDWVETDSPSELRLTDEQPLRKLTDV